MDRTRGPDLARGPDFADPWSKTCSCFFLLSWTIFPALFHVRLVPKVNLSEYYCCGRTLYMSDAFSVAKRARKVTGSITITICAEQLCGDNGEGDRQMHCKPELLSRHGQYPVDWLETRHRLSTGLLSASLGHWILHHDKCTETINSYMCSTSLQMNLIFTSCTFKGHSSEILSLGRSCFLPVTEVMVERYCPKFYTFHTISCHSIKFW